MNTVDEWTKSGASPDQYAVSVDDAVVHNDHPSVTIRFEGAEDATGSCELFQTLPADKFHDKRLRMTGFLKSDHVDTAGLWMRIDGGAQILAFDNMATRPVKNSTDWKRYEVVLDVPAKATGIAYGVLLNGKGQIWFADFHFEEVGNDVAITVKKSRKATARA